jgi:hypothetical protein
MDPHWFGSLDAACIRILMRFEKKSWIRIRIETNADPQHWSLGDCSFPIFLTEKV